MASIALHLRFRPRAFLRPFSSSSSTTTPNNATPPNPETPETDPNPKSSFMDLKSHLRNQQQQQHPRSPFSLPQRSPADPNTTGTPPTIDDIRNNLRGFRARSNNEPISFHEIYKKSAPDTPSSPSASSPSSPLNPFSSIREHLRKRSPDGDPAKSKTTSPFNLSGLRKSIQENQQAAGGATQRNLPLRIFDKELNSEKGDPGSALARPYSCEELGKRLRELRPDGGVKEFSLSELNERLVKLREIEKREEASGGHGMFETLRRTIKDLNHNENMNAMHSVNLMSQIGRNANYMLTPPKEHLVEKYFHPDNMSSAEKMKIELKSVRDEFKMSETDCGSTRVQIAQLTAEISHLSKVLHKKDKHSLKGLIAKVQLRKKLLKYLRRTDWDSYCFILSKLELRDNPGFKESPSKKNAKPSSRNSSKKKRKA